MPPALSPRDKRFCEEYLRDLDARNAALRAGFSPALARRAEAWIHPDHPAKPPLRAEVDRLLAESSARLGINAERILRELAGIAFANLTELLDPATSQLRSDFASRDTAALARIHCRQTPNGPQFELVAHDKIRALELLGKHLGLFRQELRVQQLQPLIIDDVGADDNPPPPEDGAPPQG